MHPKGHFREAILEAAEEIVMETGAQNLTLSAVASRAGVSKGGLLYHFQTKRELIQATLKRAAERLDKEAKRQGEDLPETPSRRLKAQLLAHDVTSRYPQVVRTKRLFAGLLAAAALDPELATPLRHEYETFFRELTEAGLSREKAAVVCLASDGLCLLDLVHVSPFDEETRERILEELLRLADGAELPRKETGEPAGATKGAGR